MACFWKTTQFIFNVIVPNHIKNKLNEMFLKFIPPVALNDREDQQNSLLLIIDLLLPRRKYLVALGSNSITPPRQCFKQLG